MRKTLMSFTTKSQWLPLVVALGLFTQIGCKEYTVLPPDLVPPVDNISTFQDFNQPIITNNEYQDSMATGGVINGVRIASNPTFYHAIGSIELDPIFGSTFASSHIEVVPPVANYSFKTGTNRVIDSVVLSVPYVSMYGDSMNSIPQTFNVYRSLQKLSRDSVQYEFTKDVFNQNDILGQQTIDFKSFRTDSPKVGNSKAAPQLRFKLNSTFTQALSDQVDSAANGAAATPEKFLAWCNGFQIRPATKQGSALGYFNTYGARLNIYYRYTTTLGVQDTVVDVFGYDAATCNRYNSIERDYSQSQAKRFVQSSDPNGDSVLFVQNTPGIAAIMKFPALTNYENVIVNKAELTFTKVSPYPFDFSTIYGAMPRMQILQKSSEGADVYPKDYSSFGTEFVGGKSTIKVINGISYTQYKFNLSATFQKVISQKDSTFALKIMGQNTSELYPAAYRVLLRGNASQATELKPTLNLIYTKIK